MKKILLAAAAALMLTACGGGAGSKAGSPVDEIANLLDKAVALTLDNPQSEELMTIGEKMEAVFEANKEYVLTEADKAALYNKLIEVTKSAAKSQFAQIEEAGLDIDALLEEQLKEAKDKIDACNTLGELAEVFE